MKIHFYKAAIDDAAELGIDLNIDFVRNLTFSSVINWKSFHFIRKYGEHGRVLNKVEFWANPNLYARRLLDLLFTEEELAISTFDRVNGDRSKSAKPSLSPTRVILVKCKHKFS